MSADADELEAWAEAHGECECTGDGPTLVRTLAKAQRALAFTLEVIDRMLPPDATQGMEDWEAAGFTDALNEARHRLRDIAALVKEMRDD